MKQVNIEDFPGYPCEGCRKDGLVSCDWRECEEYQRFLRPVWANVTRTLRPRGLWERTDLLKARRPR